MSLVEGEERKKELAPDAVILEVPNKIIGERNPRGIPASIFVENVDEFMKTLGVTTIDTLIGAYQQLYSKYKFMEANLQKNKNAFKNRIPETENDLAMLRHLISCKENGEKMKTHFSLADNVYAKGVVDTSNEKVCIWLGASIMVEYSYAEALELLTNNLHGAVEKMRQINEDLSFLRDQIITTEVNIARIFNHDVRLRRQERDDKLVAEIEGK